MSRKVSRFEKLADDFMSSSSSPSKNARLSFLCLLLFLPSNQKSIHIEYMPREAPNPESFLELFGKQLLLTSKSAHILPLISQKIDTGGTHVCCSLFRWIKILTNWDHVRGCLELESAKLGTEQR
jgi:hypothetical protein